MGLVLLRFRKPKPSDKECTVCLRIYSGCMVLVTGATGLLGSYLIKELLPLGQPIRALYHRARTSLPHHDKVEWIQADILDMPRLEEAMQEVTQVYHCAALVSFNPDETHNLYQTNVEGTTNVVNACLGAGVRKLLHVSSVATLGKAKEEVLTESSQWTESKSGTVYGKTKHLAEMEVWRGVGEGLNAVIINPSIILGSGNWNEGSSKLFKTAYEEFPWYTDGITGFVDVADVAKAACLLMHSDITEERFILNADNIPYHQLFNMIADAFGKKRPSKKVTPFLASLIWRAEKIRHHFSGGNPLLTKETAANAQAKRYYDGTRILHALPNFHYTPLPQTVLRICSDYELIYNLTRIR